MREHTTRRTMLGLAGTALATLSTDRLFAATPPVKPSLVPIPTATGRMTMVTHWRARARRGTILFSHGALSSPARYDRLILPWAAAGFDVWAPLHVDSPDHPDTRSYPGFASWRARIEDMRALAATIGAGPRVAAGHSYGGLVALTLGGAAADVPEGLTGPLADPRVTAVLAFSPPAPIKGLMPPAGYATIAVPALIQTGDKDVALGKGAVDPASWKNHLAPYEQAAPGGDRYALVLSGVDHFFGGLICWLDQPGPAQSTQLAVAADISRLFVEAYGASSPKALRALDARLRDDGPVILRRK